MEAYFICGFRDGNRRADFRGATTIYNTIVYNQISHYTNGVM
jgi:hypothetical protein